MPPEPGESEVKIPLWKYLVCVVGGGVFLAAVLLFHLLTDSGDVHAGNTMHYADSIRILGALFLLSMFCILVLIESVGKSKGSRQKQILAGIVTGVLIPFVLLQPVHVIVVGALAGGLLGACGRYWIRILDGL